MNPKKGKTKTCWMNALVLMFIGALQVVACHANATDEARLAIIYPEVREPYAAIYREYVRGIENAKTGKLSGYAINGDGLYAYKESLFKFSPSVYIALGNKSVGKVVELNAVEPIVGAITSGKYSDKLSAGILLKPSAEIYLKSLLEIYEEVKDIYVVYNEKNNSDLINDAKIIFLKKNINLFAYEVDGIKEAANTYRKILKEADDYSAIWLMADSSLIDSSILGQILDVAWDKKLIVFSSNPLFVKHGALFAIYPDNEGVGYSLGLMAADVSKGSKSKVKPLTSVRLALNERTRNHLGIEIPDAFKTKIDFMLPGN